MSQFFRCISPDSHFLCSEEEADASIASLHDVDESYANIDFFDVFQFVDIEKVDLETYQINGSYDALGDEKVFWGATSAETRQAMIAAKEATKDNRETLADCLPEPDEPKAIYELTDETHLFELVSEGGVTKFLKYMTMAERHTLQASLDAQDGPRWRWLHCPLHIDEPSLNDEIEAHDAVAAMQAKRNANPAVENWPTSGTIKSLVLGDDDNTETPNMIFWPKRNGFLGTQSIGESNLITELLNRFCYDFDWETLVAEMSGESEFCGHVIKRTDDGYWYVDNGRAYHTFFASLNAIRDYLSKSLF
jgi:hypothetical protein